MNASDVGVYTSSLFEREIKSYLKKKSNKLNNNNFQERLEGDCESIRKVVLWGLNEGINFNFHVMNIDCYYNSLVSINSRSKPFKQLCIILHEIGHHLVQTSKDYKIKYSGGYVQCDSFKRKNFEHRYLILEEEISAWAKGSSLASSVLNWTPQLEKEYDKVKIDMIRGYVNWASTTTVR